MLDALYVTGIFAIMTVAAVGAHLMARWALSEDVDPFIVWVLRFTTWVLATFDAVGVVCGAGFALWRLIRAMANDD